MSGDDLERQALERIGTTLKQKWTLESVLGIGGMAAVYVGRHRNASRAAVKVLHRELSVDGGIRSRFLREGYVANTVDHPGAVRVIDDDVAEDGSVFLVMELLQGETIEARARRKGGRLPSDFVLSIADQLLDILAAAHAKGILHRDIKPENLFLTSDGRLKVLDFGIARLRDAAQSSATRSGTMMGTPAFMAPEQALGRASEIDVRTDVWAVGATMFTLLTGTYVHNGESANEVLVRAATERAPATRERAPDVPPEVAVVVDRALSFDRDRRWSDALAFQDGIRRAYHADIAYQATVVQPVPVRDPGRPMAVPAVARDSVVDPDEATRVALGAAPRPVTAVAVSRSVSSGSGGSGKRVAIGAGAALLLAIPVAVLMVRASRTTEPASAASAVTTFSSVSEASIPPVVSADPSATRPTVAPVSSVTVDAVPSAATASPLGKLPTKKGSPVTAATSPPVKPTAAAVTSPPVPPPRQKSLLDRQD
jgi:eukaryotic-like serine/threonine-protein kinase